MSNNNNYYYKYLKYKKKYLELLEGGSRHHHGHHHHNHHHRNINNRPIIIGPNQPFLVPNQPFLVPTSPRIIATPQIVTSPRIIATPQIVTSPRIIASPIILGSQVFNNRIIDNYNEFNSAFDFFNKKFDKDTFIKIFNSSYIIGSKMYKGKNIIDIQREKASLVSYFISENVWTLNIINTFEILMNKLQFKLFYTPDQRIEFQEKIKRYIVLDELSHIII